MIAGEKILITGGAGFIGSALTARLADNNKIRIFDILRRNALAEAGLDKHPNVELVKGDVRDFAAVKQATHGMEHVIHMASIAGVDTVLKNPVLTMEVSIEGTMNALRAAKEEGNIKRFIDFSTSEVFGSFAFRVREADVTSLGAVGEARWTYAVSKLATEHLAHNYWKQFGLPSVSIRPFNIYGRVKSEKGRFTRLSCVRSKISRFKFTMKATKLGRGATSMTLSMGSSLRWPKMRRLARASTSETLEVR